MNKHSPMHRLRFRWTLRSYSAAWQRNHTPFSGSFQPGQTPGKTWGFNQYRWEHGQTNLDNRFGKNTLSYAFSIFGILWVVTNNIVSCWSNGWISVRVLIAGCVNSVLRVLRRCRQLSVGMASKGRDVMKILMVRGCHRIYLQDSQFRCGLQHDFFGQTNGRWLKSTFLEFVLVFVLVWPWKCWCCCWILTNQMGILVLLLKDRKMQSPVWWFCIFFAEK